MMGRCRRDWTQRRSSSMTSEDRRFAFFGQPSSASCLSMFPTFALASRSHCPATIFFIPPNPSVTTFRTFQPLCPTVPTSHMSSLATKNRREGRQADREIRKHSLYDKSRPKVLMERKPSQPGTIGLTG